MAVGPVALELRKDGEELVNDVSGIAARWPSQPGQGWALGTDIDEARRVCAHWASEYDFGRLDRLDRLGSSHWDGIHFLRFGPSGGIPIVLLHGWPSGPIEYEAAGRLLVPLDHPDPAHCLVTDTGLTHLGSAQARCGNRPGGRGSGGRLGSPGLDNIPIKA